MDQQHHTARLEPFAQVLARRVAAVRFDVPRLNTCSGKRIDVLLWRAVHKGDAVRIQRAQTADQL
jgi:hypothetical protein